MKMRVMILLFTTILSQEANTTVDISAEGFHFIVDHLTTDECRKLVASLYFVTDELPRVLSLAQERLPLGVTCYDLLIFWNSGKEKWQGWGKSHVIVARRLRQIGKEELARNLSLMVFHNLAEDINKTIINYVYEDKRKDSVMPKRKLLKKSHINDNRYWEIYDTLLWAAVLIMAGVFLFSCCRIIFFACKRLIASKRSREEELQCLLRDRFASIELDY